MCGIAGIWTTDQAATDPSYLKSVEVMTSLMERRGPDDQGFWQDPTGHLALGFRRLAVIDPSPAGHQPMVSKDGQSVLVFNGEIYNFKELKKKLEYKGIVFRSQTDTEVLLEGLHLYGVDFINQLNGMFGFAWYHIKKKQLILARDHAGIKPLYYSLHPSGKGIAFASQFNCLLHAPWQENKSIRQDVLHLYLRYGHIPPAYTLLENSFQLEPGHYLKVDQDGNIEKQCWWHLPRNPEPSLRGQKAQEAVSEALFNAIQRQRIADVPLGTFISGGIDSPLVTAIANKQAPKSLDAFTIENPGWLMDEAFEAKRYAKMIGVCHHGIEMNTKIALQKIKEVAQAHYEPFGDYSVLPELLISQHAKKKITVALSGDGGDELFFGYMRPLSLLKGGSSFRWPWWVRAGLYGAGKYYLGPKRSSVIVYKSPGHYYSSVNSRFREEDAQALTLGSTSLPDDFTLYESSLCKDKRDLANFSRYVEFYGQLQRCLKKVDMASMYHSLEVRVPFLDREVIDVSLRLDPLECMSKELGKLHLRKELAHYIPEEAISKRKLGFGVPLNTWLKRDLKELVHETLFDQSSLIHSYIDLKTTKRFYQEHQQGKDRKWGLWSLLSFEWWLKHHYDQSLVTV